MTLLDRYIIRQFCRNLFLVLASFAAVYVLLDFIERLELFNKADDSISLIGRYFLLKLPMVVEQLLPVSLLLAGIVTLGILNRQHELNALKSGGISTGRIVLPIVAAAIGLTLLSVMSRQWLLPATVSAANRIWYEQVQSGDFKGISRNGRTYYRGREGIYSFDDYFPEEGRFTQFHYVKLENSTVDLYLAAEDAVWQSQWIFRQGQLKTLSQGEYQVEIFQQKELVLPETPKNFFFLGYRLDEMSLSQLLQRAANEAKAGSNSATGDFHRQLSFLFLGLPLLLLGLPVLLLGHQRWQRDLSLAIPVCSMIAFVVWGGWGAFLSLAKVGYLPPLVASWSVHLLVGGLGIYLLRLQDR